MTETILGLVRHGQTDWNAQLRLQGVSDIPLNATGVLQARLAVNQVNSADWDVVLASPLSRARDTAKAFAIKFGLEVEIVPDLIERSFGEAEGLSHSEWRRVFESHEPIPGLESMEDLEARSIRLLETIASAYQGKRVLAISHGSLIRKVLRIVSNLELPLPQDRMENLSLSTLVHSDGQWSVRTYSSKSLAEIVE